MGTRFEPLRKYREDLGISNRSFLDRIMFSADITLGRVVAVLSLGIFGAIGMVAGNPVIYVLALAPIFAFQYLLDR